MQDDETRTGFSAIVVWGVGIVIVLLIAAVAFMGLQPLVVKYNNDVNRNSQGYTESKQQLLLSLVSNYYDLDTQLLQLGNSESEQEAAKSLKAQQIAIVNRIHAEADLLSPGDIPQSVRVFIQEHPSH